MKDYKSQAITFKISYALVLFTSLGILFYKLIKLNIVDYEVLSIVLIGTFSFIISNFITNIKHK